MPVLQRGRLRRGGRLEHPRAGLCRTGRARPRARAVDRRDRCRGPRHGRCRRAHHASSTTRAWTSRSASTSRSRRPGIRSSSGSTPTPSSSRATPSAAWRALDRTGAAQPRRHHGRDRPARASRPPSRAPTTAGSASAAASYHGEHAEPGPGGVGLHGHHAGVRGRARSVASTRRCAAARTGSSTTACARPATWCGSTRACGSPTGRADTWNKLARQFLATGIWRGELIRRLGAKQPAALLRAAGARRQPGGLADRRVAAGHRRV